jgi:hypothetical protein
MFHISFLNDPSEKQEEASKVSKNIKLLGVLSFYHFTSAASQPQLKAVRSFKSSLQIKY